MKSILFIIGFLFVNLGLLLSQEVKERKMSMSLGPQNSWYIEIGGADGKMAEKILYEYIKSYGKMKYNKKAREHFLMSAAIPNINGSSPMDIYAKIDDTKTQATVYVWMDMGGAFISAAEHSKQSAALKQWLFEYYLEVKKSVIMNEIKEEEKKLSSLERDLKKLLDKNAGLHNDIEKAKQKITQAESDIEKNLEEQKNKNLEIDNQRELLNQVNEKLNKLGKN